MATPIRRNNHECCHNTSVVTAHVDHVVGFSILVVFQVSSLGQDVVNLLLVTIRGSVGRLFHKCLSVHRVERCVVLRHQPMVRPVWRCLQETLGELTERVKPMSWNCAMRVGPLKASGDNFCSFWPWYWALQKGRGRTPKSQPHLSRDLCHLSCLVHHPCRHMDCARDGEDVRRSDSN